ncbi:Carbohydrate-binding WSC [Metarhizium rileyi]|uniref:Carbohydrate-binding WSC n=1 Tax=Metarhizium rileyi (strain RCEF 4871) TaxID=1649241 RepID=A0A162JUC6_METRR|nr:Carbohydrate-binding WSC [Metarhizium rileyi RCEF 4871]TWU77854.1 hypothetical protein ED733_003218 [Metarhizium rileyi]
MIIIRVFLLIAFVTVAAAQQNVTVQTYKESKTYTYYGCYNETTEIEGSDHSRALSGGANQVKQGEMTVPMCLDFCNNGENGTHYRYAGLEWARECWCAQSIAGISAKLDDSECNFPCEGNNSLACGASLKLSVYRMSSAAAVRATITPALLASFVSAMAAFASF